MLIDSMKVYLRMEVCECKYCQSAISNEFLADGMDSWMSHGDKLSQLPTGFVTIATTQNSPYASIAHETKPIFGIQFHPEVTHTPRGTELLKNFAVGICAVKQNWTMTDFLEKEVARIRKLVGSGQVIGAVSGGVDSTVAAKLSKLHSRVLILFPFLSQLIPQMRK